MVLTNAIAAFSLHRILQYTCCMRYLVSDSALSENWPQILKTTYLNCINKTLFIRNYNRILIFPRFYTEKRCFHSKWYSFEQSRHDRQEVRMACVVTASQTITVIRMLCLKHFGGSSEENAHCINN